MNIPLQRGLRLINAFLGARLSGLAEAPESAAMCSGNQVLNLGRSNPDELKSRLSVKLGCSYLSSNIEHTDQHHSYEDKLDSFSSCGKPEKLTPMNKTPETLENKCSHLVTAVWFCCTRCAM